MPFQYILANLLAQSHAVGVLFLDSTGETVDVACSDFTPYEMRVLGAYLGIYLKQMGASLESWAMGEPTMVHIEKERLHIYALPLPEGYYLVLVQRRPAMVGQARILLDEAAEQLVKALF
jgi:predicted regulator of Ras-like GTPase activity (Roadblock/LC7/MglB family)